MSKLIRISRAKSPLALLCLLGCNVQTASETSSQTGVPAPAPAAAQVAPRAKVPAHVADLESSGVAPSAEVVAKIGAISARLSGAIANVPGSRVAFVNCEQASCGARLSATSLEALKASLDSVSQDQQGRIGFVVRERLDPYQGRSFEADVTLDADAPRAVPTEPSELLENGMPVAP